MRSQSVCGRSRGEGKLDWNERKRMRSARMPIRSAVFLSRGGNAWSSEVLNISASGVLVGRPQAWEGRIGDRYALDMLFGERLDIHVEARLTRVTGEELAFAYERIPEDKEAPLWELLGGYADRLDSYPEN